MANLHPDEHEWIINVDGHHRLKGFESEMTPRALDIVLNDADNTEFEENERNQYFGK